MILTAKADESTASCGVARYVAVCDVLGFLVARPEHFTEGRARGLPRDNQERDGSVETHNQNTWPDRRTEMCVANLVGTAVLRDIIIVWSRPKDAGLTEPT
jgi:hypothetical protein